MLVEAVYHRNLSVMFPSRNIFLIEPMFNLTRVDFFRIPPATVIRSRPPCPWRPEASFELTPSVHHEMEVFIQMTSAWQSPAANP